MRSLVVLAMIALAALAVLARPATAVDQLVVPPTDGVVVRSFDPPATRFGRGHRGVDVAARPGQRVRAALGGTVSFAGDVAGVGWVTVDHGGGLDTTYGPIADLRVRRGEQVRTGEPLGRLRRDTTHVDWGARLDGEYVDPLSLLTRWDIALIHPDEDVPAAAGRVAGRRSGSITGGLLLPVTGTVTSGFGRREHPITGATRFHDGVDIAAPTGTAVVAAADGVVIAAEPVGAYGNLVVVEHARGVETRYAHLSAVIVSDGDDVTAGEQIGAVGSTGLSTGPHLHFEVRLGGVAQDPLQLLS